MTTFNVGRRAAAAGEFAMIGQLRRTAGPTSLELVA